jgi:hypothetical protein
MGFVTSLLLAADTLCYALAAMSLKAPLIALTCCFFTLGAHAAGDSALPYETAADFARLCESGAERGATAAGQRLYDVMCSAYVVGVLDGMWAAQARGGPNFACLKGRRISNAETVDIVRAYIVGGKVEKEAPANVAVYLAIDEAFPCPKR